ncbi:DUF2066 domain-containing protein [Microbaculum marinum]|uniref:DUF2066 domain-containing protein n=1 Tax=Microbaculum marinum TaxID=1764581 RepID=A0AAW9RWK6_9HYPH
MRAEAFDPYEVRGIVVSAVAEDAVAAKKLAMDEALSTAARRIFDRVAVAPADIEIGAADAATLLSSLENSSERFGPGGYSATVTVRFDPLLARGYLADRGIAVVDRVAPPILLIPLVVEGGEIRIWDDAAAWARTLGAVYKETGLTPVRIANGTSADRAARLDRLMEADPITLGEFRIRYRTRFAAIARLDRDAEGEPMLLSLVGTDAAGPVNATVELRDGTLENAASAAAGLLSSRWKEVAGGGGTIGPVSGRGLPVRVLLPGGPAGWEPLKLRLEGSGVIDALSVARLDDTGADVEIWYAGRLDELPGRLAAAGLDLFEAGGTWLLQAY